jgi:hypothetical protein
VPIPLLQAGQLTGANAVGNSPVLNLNEQYSIDIVRGDRRTGQRAKVTSGGFDIFNKPVDNIGTKTIPDYPAYAQKHIYDTVIPGCNQPGKVFVGQRQEPFAVNVGQIFDLVNAPLGLITDPTKINAAPNPLAGKNITTLALEVHQSCLTAGSDPVIGGWISASLRQGRLLDPSPKSGHQTTDKSGGAWVQVSRLGNPLVNEVVIGVPDKDKFNGSHPTNDGANFLNYVTNPTLPRLLEVAFGMDGKIAPTNAGRNDLVTTFLTGIPGVNKPANVTASEMLRLNTAIPPVPFAQQNRLGLVGNILAGGNDNAGYPNGRRPKDDVTDISLIAVVGGLCVANGDNNKLGFGAECRPSAVPLGNTALNIHDAVDQAQVPFLDSFPYINTPIPGNTAFSASSAR